MDHSAARRLSDPVDVELREDDRERRSAIASRGDPLADRGDQHAIEICLGDRTLARRRHLRDDGERSRLGIAQETDERREHGRPALALGHPLGRAERRETDRRGGARREIPALDERLQRAAECARREWQPLRRDRSEQRGRPRRPRGETLEQIEPEERGCESGRGRANRGLPPMVVTERATRT